MAERMMAERMMAARMSMIAARITCD